MVRRAQKQQKFAAPSPTPCSGVVIQRPERIKVRELRLESGGEGLDADVPTRLTDMYYIAKVNADIAGIENPRSLTLIL